MVTEVGDSKAGESVGPGHTTASFERSEFARHSDGRSAMRLGRGVSVPWLLSSGETYQDWEMPSTGFEVVRVAHAWTRKGYQRADPQRAKDKGTSWAVKAETVGLRSQADELNSCANELHLRQFSSSDSAFYREFYAKTRQAYLDAEMTLRSVADQIEESES